MNIYAKTIKNIVHYPPCQAVTCTAYLNFCSLRMLKRQGPSPLDL